MIATVVCCSFTHSVVPWLPPQYCKTCQSLWKVHQSCCKKHHCELLTAQSCVRPFLSSTICAQKPPLETSMNQLSRTATSLATMSPAWNKILLPIHGCVIICSTAMSHMLNDAVPSTMLHCLCIIVDIFLLIVLFLAWQ